MDFLTETLKHIEQFLDSNQSLLTETDEELITPKTIKMREELITTLTLMTEHLQTGYDKLRTAVTQAKKIYDRDIHVLNKMLNRSKPSTIQSITRTYVSAAAGTKDDIKIPDPLYSNISFTKQLSLPAIKVASFNQVKQNGELYYVESADHFAIKLCGRLLHGNIGIIYVDEKNPEKIKDCKFANACVKRDKCDYYHDPIKFNGSKDRRNFISSSFVYSPYEGYYKTKALSRRFGSRKYLDEDIAVLPAEEIRRFHDQAMHDLLCSLLLYTNNTM